MKKIFSLAGLSVLTACTAPNVGGSGPPPTANGIPAVLAKNLNAAGYVKGANTVTIEMQALDASPFVATYTRNLAFDVPGYEAYDIKETALQRHFVGLFATSGSGSLTAGAVTDGGQFNRFFNGATYARIATYTQPTAGLASYAAKYGGLITNNGGTAGDPPIRVTGDVLINADFTNGQVNGAVINRVDMDGFGLTLVDLALPATAIAADGTFLGSVEYVGKPNVTAGDFGGLFGGVNASDIAGVLIFHPINYDTKITETGLFVAPCVTNLSGTGVPCP